ncbi:MAG: Lipopolysaccharide export system permease protein LptG [Rhodocyclaceae bacterium]|nr:Lipopolysaccharide export system permease protein LptG [Rhodocyclaceae bacterium]
MKIYQRYIARDIISASALVLGAFVMLFAFFDFVQELEDLGRGGYALQHIVSYVALLVPGRCYELIPVSVLIGALYALAMLARHSEIGVLRTSGLSTGSLAALLLGVGTMFGLVAFVLGEYVAPAAERYAQQLRLQATSQIIGQEFRSGIWIKDDRTFINVQAALPDSRLLDVRIFDFDERNILTSISLAEKAEFRPPDSWLLSKVVRTHFQNGGTRLERLDEVSWRSALNPDLLNVLIVQPERMSVGRLIGYIDHLEENRQDARRFHVALWKKLVYPFACLVMVLLALPFALVHDRIGATGLKVFGGVMTGIFFHTLNGLFSNLGVINSWPPPVSVLTPSLAFTAIAGVLLWRAERR